MASKSRLSFLLIVLGIVTLPFVRILGGEYLLVSMILISFGTVRLVRGSLTGERLRRLWDSERRPTESRSADSPARRIDPLLPVRVLKLAEARSGVLTVSSVAMALNVSLDECQIALDELVRKGAANADVDIATGIASYFFPEFLPHTVEGAGPL
jgi:hypothetical protein